MPASTSGAPLVPRRRKRKAKKDSWWNRHVSKPLSKLSPATLLGRRRRPKVPRSVFINDEVPADYFDKKGKVLKSKMFSTNQNITSKYTILTFLPRNLLEQFRRIANIFFLFINILQFFPKFSTISPGLVILPLIVVLFITALKDGYEDVKRHQSDRKVNYSIVHVLGGGGYVNPNPMESKAKTFVRGIPIPRRRSKKLKKGELEEASNILKNGENGETNPEALRRMSTIRSQVSHWDEDPEAGDSQKELGWQRTIWEDVKVGDFVKIYDNEPIPADIIVCATSEEEDVCYVETKGLDGETNLKSRHAVPGLTHLDSIQACSTTKLRIDLEAPEVNMYRLNGAIIIPGEDDSAGLTHPITLDTCLLRGCSLRNTGWVIGIVAFTGDDTKIIQNSGAAPSKRSRVERQMNPQVLFNLGVLGIIAMICAVIGHFLETRWTADGAYWMLFNDTSQDNPQINGLWTFFNATITFQNIIPISLYLSIEFVRTVQALFIYWDHQMQYFKNGNKIRTTARSWNLSDDLGQIEYIFSDKTGTLTQNVMVFRQCSVGGKIYYGDGPAQKETPKTDKPVEDAMSSSDDNSNSTDATSLKRPKEREIPPFRDHVLEADLENTDSEQSRILHGFFVVLGLCHTALASEPEPGHIQYKAQSPDEAALVQSAADVGFVFLGRDRNILRLRTPYSTEPDEYELLHVLEFNSTRKRMSVIVRKCDDQGMILLLSKGADNIIFDLLSKDDSQATLREKTDKDLQVFASEGLRTLCLAYRVLDPAEYAEWAEAYHNAEVAMTDREAKMEQTMASIETNLQLLGATAIEDKLQDGVPECIADLKRAGINIWVATGDKLETAVAIGYTTNLLTPESNLIIVREGNHTIAEQLRDSLEGFFGDDSLRRSTSLTQLDTRHSTQLRRVNTGVGSLVGDDNGRRPGGFSLVIEGSALSKVFEDDECQDLLIALALKCNTVICCRVSPLQKAQIVRLIKDNLGVMCLAIGDGANDVSMIQAADVGVGISGEEGLQAVNSADYATGQFRYLKRLLLVHGHWSYYRNGTMICNFFYKNIVGIGILFWYMFFCGWSTTFVYAYIYLLFWNVFWTLCPVIAMGVFERNAEDVDLMALPELYRYSREHRYYNWPRFLYYLFEGVYQTAIVYFFVHYTYVTTTTRTDGWEVYKDEMSTTMAIAAVMAANLFSGLNLDAWSWWVVFAVWVGPFLIWVFTPIYSVVPPTTYISGVYGNDIFLFRSAAYWFGWPFVLILALLPRYLIKFSKQNLFPNDIDIMRLVRKYQPDVDPYTHPMLGGRLNQAHANDDVALGRVHTYGDDHRARNSVIALQELTSGHNTPARAGTPRQSTEHAYPPRQSTEYMVRSTRQSVDSHRSGRPVRPSLDMGPPRASFTSNRTGTAVDMSTGLTREPSRGFGFNIEEGGVAIKRMQSRLSQVSQEQGQRYVLRRLNVQNRQPSVTGSPNSAFKTLRTRAGSILRPRGRSSTVNTRASHASQGEEAGTTPPVPSLPTSPPATPRPHHHQQQHQPHP